MERGTPQVGPAPVYGGSPQFFGARNESVSVAYAASHRKTTDGPGARDPVDSRTASGLRGGGYSVLSASRGSTRAARRAGTALASSATRSSEPAAIANVAGSRGATPKS